MSLTSSSIDQSGWPIAMEEVDRQRAHSSSFPRGAAHTPLAATAMEALVPHHLIEATRPRPRPRRQPPRAARAPHNSAAHRTKQAAPLGLGVLARTAVMATAAVVTYTEAATMGAAATTTTTTTITVAALLVEPRTHQDLGVEVASSVLLAGRTAHLARDQARLGRLLLVTAGAMGVEALKPIPRPVVPPPMARATRVVPMVTMEIATRAATTSAPTTITVTPPQHQLGLPMGEASPHHLRPPRPSRLAQEKGPSNSSNSPSPSAPLARSQT